eukprot:COSAG05_NODE_1051_length_6031_cov_8.987190_4_plen_1129_part_01
MVLRRACIAGATILLSFFVPVARSQNCGSFPGRSCCDPKANPAQFCPNNIACPHCGQLECECPEVARCENNPWGNHPGYRGNCAGTPPEGTCTAECAPGYAPRDGADENAEFKCDAQGKWVIDGDGGELICDGVKCEGPPVNHAVPASGQYGDGKRIENTCAAGFKQSHLGDNHYVCGQGGQWVGDPGGMQCAEDKPESDCPAVSPVPYSRRCTPSRSGSTCVTACKTGFIPSGLPDFRCANGSWIGGTLVCSPVPCDSTGSGLPPHATCPNSSTYNQTCFPTCAPGYEPSDSESQYVCGVDGRWSGNTFGCELLPLRQPCTKYMWSVLRSQAPENTTQCVNVSFAAAILGAVSASIERGMWQDGFRFFQNHTNSNGGLRLGAGLVGFVDVQVHTMATEQALLDQYVSWSTDPKIAALITPLDSDQSSRVLETLMQHRAHVGSTGISAGPPKLILAGGQLEQTHSYSNVWSVFGPARQWDVQAVRLLRGLGAQSFAITGLAGVYYEGRLANLKQAIEDLKGAVAYALLSKTSTNSPTELRTATDAAVATKPDVFVGLGDLTTFTVFAEYFKSHKYAPKAAFFSSSLLTTQPMCDDSYTSQHCINCVVYDQWMGTKAWTATMPYNGPAAWPGDKNGLLLPDRYRQRDGNGIGNPKQPVFNSKAKRRYLGSSAEFAATMSRWLSERHTSGGNNADAAAVTAFHAQAVATLSMLQMALEMAPQGGGWGFPFDDLFKASKVEEALRALNASTFWGQLYFGLEQHNSAYQGGLAQFPRLQAGGQCTAAPNLIGPASCAFELAPPVYPADWPCELTDTCATPAPEPHIIIDNISRLRRWLGGGFWPVFSVAILVLLLCCGAIVRCCSCVCGRKSRGSRNEFSMLRNALRESLLSGKELPDIALASNDVDARWVETARKHSEYVHASEQALLSGALGSSSPVIPGTGSRSLAGQSLTTPSPGARRSALARTYSASSSSSSTKGRKPKGTAAHVLAAPRLVMFSNGHVSELRPQNWHHQKLGSGPSGTVYNAVWRDQEVAIKEFTLPSVPKGASKKAVEDMRQTIRRITKAYVKVRTHSFDLSRALSYALSLSRYVCACVLVFGAATASFLFRSSAATLTTSTALLDLILTSQIRV